MKLYVVVFILLFFFIKTLFASDFQFSKGLIIKYKAQANTANKIFKTLYALRTTAKERNLNLEFLEIGDKQNLEKTINEVSDLPDIEYIEPDFIITLDSYKEIETDSSYFSDNYSYLPWGLEIIDAQDAWSIIGRSIKTVVAIVDSGIDYFHENLRDNIWVNKKEIPNDGIDNDHNGFIDDNIGWNFADNNNDPMDDLDHGTHVAGIIGATGMSNPESIGVNPNALLMPVKFISRNGSGSTSAAIHAILYAVDNGARIINNSWGSTSYSRALEEALSYAENHDVLTVAAAGNSSDNNDRVPHYPASYSLNNIISVGAIDEQIELAEYSNYGKRSVDLVAPGSNIYSTIPSGYENFSGTSMASPFVAGVASLVSSAYPRLSSIALRDVIIESASKRANLRGLTLSSGILNATESLNNAKDFRMVQKKNENLIPGCGSLNISSNKPSNGPTILLLLVLPIIILIQKKYNLKLIQF